jgi:leucyl aminopeptidase
VPSYDVTERALTEVEVDAIAIGAFAAADLAEDEEERRDVPPDPTLGDSAADIGGVLGTDLLDELRALRFDGSVGSLARLTTRGALPAPTILVIGLGKAADLDREAVRRAAARVAKATTKLDSVATDLHVTAASALDLDAAAQSVLEGFDLAAYRFTAYKTSGTSHAVEGVHLHGGEDAGAVAAGIARGRTYAAAARSARDLVNEPPMNKRPPAFAERVAAALDGSPVQVRILDEEELEEGGYGGMIAVGKGSDAPPRLVELTYDPGDADRHVALVGKGITFDSGGLSLKPSKSMMTMKLDMGGAAAVFAVVKAAAELGLDVKVTGILALAENMPSASAQRPSDVYTARNGKTVEVLNTDAEGRLVLSDALSHASELEPDAIIDLATLTGAVKVALGPTIGGLMSNDDDLADELVTAGELAGERLWRLPLPDDYRDHIKSEVADMKNIGKPQTAGTIIGGLFLREFVAEGIPWAHLDIAELAWSEENRHYTRKGGTGAPVRTLLGWLDGTR